MPNLEGRPRVVVGSRGEQRVRAGHPWIYQSDVVDVDASGGDVVDVFGPRGVRIGAALWSDRSQISLRFLTYGDAPAGEALLRARLERAIAFRESLRIDATAYRLVHGEGDLLPSLIVDRYGDYLVVQALSQGMDRLLPVVTGLLRDLLAPAGILARNDPKVRTLEGLEQRVDVLDGTIPEAVLVREGAVEYEVDLRHGQKTGLFLDQRENREAVAKYARGRLLDAFSYNGGFALALARQCARVEAVDISADAVARITANAGRNGLPQIEVRQANVFDELRRLERAGERYDTIVLDPSRGYGTASLDSQAHPASAVIAQGHEVVFGRAPLGATDDRRLIERREAVRPEQRVGVNVIEPRVSPQHRFPAQRVAEVLQLATARTAVEIAEQQGRHVDRCRAAHEA
jgi:23S rRNA (cytosine1962-C5)-methyltransferase